MATIHYIILAHNNPKHFKRLIYQLDQPEVKFYVHIDKRVCSEPFQMNLDNVFFIKNRAICTWGGLGTIYAMLSAFQQIIRERQTGHCILLSGIDYPIKSNKYIKDFFSEKPNTCFISTTALPEPGMMSGGMDRICQYKYDLSDNKGDFVQIPPLNDGFTKYHWGLVKSCLKKGIIPYEILFPRKHPSYIKPAAGATWFAFPVDAVNEISSFLQKHSSYLRFHQRSLLPDEMVMQSIVIHLGFPVEPKVSYDNMKPTGYQTPIIFTEKNFEELIGRPELFARKFEQDSPVLDLLDKHLANKTKM